MTPAWRVAAALALACGLDWGRWAAGWTAQCMCEPYRGRDGQGSRLYHDDRCISYAAMDERGVADSARRPYVECRATPVPDPSDVDAYLIDCARRGVEPGPLPALSWGSCDRRVGWSVFAVGGEVRVRFSDPTLYGAAAIWSSGSDTMVFDQLGINRRTVAAIAGLVTAAAAALETA